MKDFSLAGGISFGHVFYTTAMVYDTGTGTFSPCQRILLP